MSADRLLHEWAGSDANERCTACGTFRSERRDGFGLVRPREKEECSVRLRAALDALRAWLAADEDPEPPDGLPELVPGDVVLIDRYDAKWRGQCTKLEAEVDRVRAGR